MKTKELHTRVKASIIASKVIKALTKDYNEFGSSQLDTIEGAIFSIVIEELKKVDYENLVNKDNQ